MSDFGLRICILLPENPLSRSSVEHAVSAPKSQDIGKRVLFTAAPA